MDEAFADERPHLVALSARPYDVVLAVERRVSREGMVSVGGNLYSVPDGTRRRTLEVQSHPSEIRIFERGRLVACHPVLEGRNRRRVDPSHRPRPPVGRGGLCAPPVGSLRDLVVAQRPPGFYDAVGRRLAAGGAG